MPHSDEHVHASDPHGHLATAHHEPLLHEPQTPGWLPAVGGGLFALLAIGWLASRGTAPTLSELTPPAPSAVAAAPEPAPTPTPAPQPEVAPAPTPSPSPAGSAARAAAKIKGKPKAKAK